MTSVSTDKHVHLLTNTPHVYKSTTMPSASANLVTILLRFRDLQRRCSVPKVEIIFYVLLKREITWWITWICIVHLIILGLKNLEDGMEGLFSKDILSGFYYTMTCIFLLLITYQVLKTKLVPTAKFIHNSWTYSEPFLILSGPTLNTFISRFNVLLTMHPGVSVQ